MSHTFLICIFVIGFNMFHVPHSKANEDYTPHVIALQKYQEGKYAEGLSILKDMAKLQPHTVPGEVFWNIGVLAFRTGQFVEASAHFEAAVRRGLFKPEAITWINETRKRISHSPLSQEPSPSSDLISIFIPWSITLGALLSGLCALGTLFFPRKRIMFVIVGVTFITPSAYEYFSMSKHVSYAAAQSPLFSQADDKAPVIATASAGDRFPIVKENGEWIQLQSHTGALLWAKRSGFLVVE